MTADQTARDLVRERHDRTLFVEAGAGTGKTTALVARVVDMIASGHLAHAGQLAAITFTENAASDLRSRIRQGLEEGGRGEHRKKRYDEPQRARCRIAAGELDDAVITTLHGFAARILSEAPLEAGLPPGFGVADSMTTGPAADQGWRDFLDELLDDDSLHEHLVVGLMLGLKLRDLRKVADALAGSWDRLHPLPLEHQDLPLISAREVLDHLSTALADEDRWPDDGLAAYLRATVKPAVAELEQLDDPHDVLEALTRRKFGCSAGPADGWTRRGLAKPVVVQALKDAETARCLVVSTTGAAVTESLGARVQGWLLVEAARRRDEGRLEYHDLLVLARDVLRDDAGVRRRLHEQWPVLLVDEFQDTDPLQVEIVCLLAGDCGNGAPPHWSQIGIPKGRLFFVGDAKQSIYRFRRADIATFAAVGDRHDDGRIALSVNFRSVPGVLRAANHAFRALIGEDPDAGIPYADLAESRSQDDASTPVLLLGGPHEAGDAATLRQLEAAHLADVIVRAEGSWVVEVDELDVNGRKHAVRRPAGFRDMAILLPTRTPLPALERALQARNVPYRIESRSLIWSTDAVRDLITLLQAIDDPGDEVALLSALRHPGLACSDVDLLAWRAAGGRWSLFAERPADLVDDHPVAVALSRLKAWHEQRWWQPVNQLVEEVVRELRLVELTASQRRPRDHWRRLRFVVDQARAWCDAGGSGLSGFASWAAQQVESDADVLETVVQEPDDEAVRILTVHGSKGLEFPVTLVSGLTAPGGSQPAVLWLDDVPQVRLKAGSLEMAEWKDATAEEDEQARREAVRLLYVALTRAMDHLVIGCYHKPPKGKDAKHTAAQKLWNLLHESGHTRAETAVPPVDASSTTTVAPVAAADLGERARVLAQRGQLLEHVRGRVATTPTALRSSLDEPVKQADLEGTEEAAARRVRPRGSREGASIGTAVHRVLELVDLENPAPELRRLSELACEESGIPQLAHDVEARVRTALSADVVQDAVEHGRALREVYVVVRDGERYLEGYIDLLAETGAGGLAVVDYKTDRVRTAADRADKRDAYAPQLAAYAEAVERVTGRRPERLELVFASRTPQDLDSVS